MSKQLEALKTALEDCAKLCTFLLMPWRIELGGVKVRKDSSPGKQSILFVHDISFHWF